jgi:hypothetical protein
MSYDLRRPRALGDYGSKLLFGNYNSRAEEFLPTAKMNDLYQSMTAIWASFDDAEGNSHLICRELSGYLTGTCWIMSNHGSEGHRLMPACRQTWVGGIIIEHSGNRVEWRSADSYQGGKPKFRMVYEDGHMEYEEDGLIHVSGHVEGTGYQFYEPTHGQGQTTHVSTAEGTIGGQAVHGLLALNTHFHHPGNNYRISEMVLGGQMLTWIDVGNVYEDGSWEKGPIVIGRDGFCGAWISNSRGEHTWSNDIDGEIAYDDNGFLARMDFRFRDARTGDPQHWVWTAKPGSNLVDIPKLAPHLKNKRSAEGSCVRMGENRKLTYTSSWPEWLADGRAEKFAAERVANVPPGFT